MKTCSKQSIMVWMLLGGLVWAIGCSEVSYGPGEAAEEILNLPPGTQLETFNFNDQDTRAKVDVLFVVDNSASMLEEQQKLGSRLSSFISSLAKIDWQIGVTTTDTSNGPFGLKGSLVTLDGTNSKILNKNTPNYETVFQNSVVRDELIGCQDPNCPSADERPLEAIAMAIDKRNSDNSGFFRPGADLAVVILSDEDERSSGGSGAMQPSEVITRYKIATGGQTSIAAFGIIIEPGDSTCYSAQSSNGGSYGRAASLFASLTGGVTGSICDTDYSSSLTSIGNKVREQVRTITLRAMPNPDTIQLRIRPFDPNLTWVVEGQTIRFNTPPKAGTRIDVMYLPF